MVFGQANADGMHVISFSTFQDTSAVASDTAKAKKKKKPGGSKVQPPEEVSNFYKADRPKKKSVGKVLYKLLFRKKKDKADTTLDVNKPNPYMPYEDKVITNVRLKKLDIFGTDVDDTLKAPKSFFGRTANNLHIKSSSRAIRKNLLFKKGRLIDAEEIYQNERLIRSLPYIRDARILIEEPDSASYGVGVVVVTQDIFPFSFDYDSRDVDSARLSVNHRNLFGLGYQLDNTFELDSDEDSRFGYIGIFRVPNILGTFIVGELEYADTRGRDYFGARAFRNFVTPDIQYAGGVELSRQTLNEIRIIGDSLFEAKSQFNFEELWVAKAYRSFFTPPAQRIKEKLRIVIAGRFTNTRYRDRPATSAEVNRDFQDRTQYLGSIGLSKRSYTKDKLIFGFGRTEDVPSGHLFELTGGYEVGEFVNRPYFGLSASKGGYIKHFGYLNGGVSAGGFLLNDRFEQGVIRARADYFSKLYFTGRSEIRVFSSLNYVIGIRRFPHEFIDIRNRNGIRSLKLDFLESAFLRGTQRLSVNTDVVVFTPWRFGGFRLALLGFLDLGWIASNDESVFTDGAYQGVGIGFRFRNDNLAFRTLQLRFAIFPRVPEGISGFRFRISSLPRLEVQDFDLRKPDIIRFE